MCNVWCERGIGYLKLKTNKIEMHGDWSFLMTPWLLFWLFCPGVFPSIGYRTGYFIRATSLAFEHSLISKVTLNKWTIIS